MPTDDNTPTGTGALEHMSGCTTPRVIEHQTPRRRLLTCRTCGAQTTLPRVTRWSDHD